MPAKSQNSNVLPRPRYGVIPNGHLKLTYRLRRIDGRTSKQIAKVFEAQSYVGRAWAQDGRLTVSTSYKVESRPFSGRDRSKARRLHRRLSKLANQTEAKLALKREAEQQRIAKPSFRQGRGQVASSTA